MSLENSETFLSTSWSSELKWCKAFVEMEEEKSYCGHVLDYWWSLADPRTKDWLLVESAYPIAAILLAYYAFVVLGSLGMKIQKPFDLRRPLIGYNIAMTLLNFLITYKLITVALHLNYNFTCESSKNSKDDREIIQYVWLHFFSKIIELFDTVFIVLRKKDRQLTFLHVYHHSSVLVFWWVVLKWVPSGSPFLIAAVNSGVHVIMYLNYTLTAARSDLANSFWWKRYITIVQMVQFSTGILLTLNALCTGCPFPQWMMWANVLYLLSFLVLFYGFYQSTYTKFSLKSE